MPDQEWIKKDIPVEPAMPISCVFTYDEPYKDKYGNLKWGTTDGQYVSVSATLQRMLQTVGVKANTPVNIGKRLIDGKTHFTVNGMGADEIFAAYGPGNPNAPQQTAPAVPPTTTQPVAPAVAQPAPQPAPAVQQGTSQPPSAGLSELKVHLESALKLVNSMVAPAPPLVQPTATANPVADDDLPF